MPEYAVTYCHQHASQTCMLLIAAKAIDFLSCQEISIVLMVVTPRCKLQASKAAGVG